MELGLCHAFHLDLICGRNTSSGLYNNRDGLTRRKCLFFSDRIALSPTHWLTWRDESLVDLGAKTTWKPCTNCSDSLNSPTYLLCPFALFSMALHQWGSILWMEDVADEYPFVRAADVHCGIFSVLFFTNHRSSDNSAHRYELSAPLLTSVGSRRFPSQTDDGRLRLRLRMRLESVVDSLAIYKRHLPSDAFLHWPTASGVCGGHLRNPSDGDVKNVFVTAQCLSRKNRPALLIHGLRKGHNSTTTSPLLHRLCTLPYEDVVVRWCDGASVTQVAGLWHLSSHS